MPALFVAAVAYAADGNRLIGRNKPTGQVPEPFALLLRRFNSAIIQRFNSMTIQTKNFSFAATASRTRVDDGGYEKSDGI